MERTIQPFWMYFEMKNYHQSWCFQYIYLYKLRKLSFFTKFPEKTIFLTKKKQDRGRWYQLCLIINLLRPWTETSLQELTHAKHTRIQKTFIYYTCLLLRLLTLSLLLQEHEHSGCVFGLSEVLASLPDHEPYSMLLLQPNSLDHWMCAGIDFTQQTSPICVWMFMYW